MQTNGSVTEGNANADRRNPATWPPHVCQALDGIAIAMMAAYMLLRERALNHGSSIVRDQAALDAKDWEIHLLNEELRLLRARFRRLDAEKRPNFQEEERLQVLKLMRFRKWNTTQAAKRFILHANTIRTWLKLLEAGAPHAFWNGIPWNKIGDGVVWLCHELKRINPAFGTRKIAMLIQRAGIAISRASVQRFLRKPRPERPDAPRATAPEPGASVHPFHILAPKKVNRTWHLDLTCFDFLFVRFYVAGLLDGYSRRLLALQVFKDAPTTDDMVKLVKEAIAVNGSPLKLVTAERRKPRFMVTDHGSQFRKRFRAAIEALGIAHVQGKVGDPKFNGKIEAFFKKLTAWQRLSFLIPSLQRIQERLDSYRAYYNRHDPLWLHRGRTPDEAWKNEKLPLPRPIRAVDPVQPAIEVVKELHADDPNLPIIHIKQHSPLKLIA